MKNRIFILIMNHYLLGNELKVMLFKMFSSIAASLSQWLVLNKKQGFSQIYEKQNSFRL